MQFVDQPRRQNGKVLTLTCSTFYALVQLSIFKHTQHCVKSARVLVFPVRIFSRWTESGVMWSILVRKKISLLFMFSCCFSSMSVQTVLMFSRAIEMEWNIWLVQKVSVHTTIETLILLLDIKSEYALLLLLYHAPLPNHGFISDLIDILESILAFVSFAEILPLGDFNLDQILGKKIVS